MAHVTVRLATPKNADIIIKLNNAMARETEGKVLAFDILSRDASDALSGIRKAKNKD